MPKFSLQYFSHKYNKVTRNEDSSRHAIGLLAIGMSKFDFQIIPYDIAYNVTH